MKLHACYVTQQYFFPLKLLFASQRTIFIRMKLSGGILHMHFYNLSDQINSNNKVYSKSKSSRSSVYKNSSFEKLNIKAIKLQAVHAP